MDIIYIVSDGDFYLRMVISMCMVSLEVPEEILIDLHEDKSMFTEYVKHKIALALYKERRVSLGYCAKLAGMTKEEFIRLLGKNDISIFSFESVEEFMEELANA